MIEEHIKIHDKFSVEMKVGFSTHQEFDENEFSMDMWMFIPNSLDINRHTYSKSDFYRDMKSNIRLITPVYLMQDIANPEAKPLRLLRESFQRVAQNPVKSNVLDYEMHIKMFQSILKSALRDESLHIKHCESDVDCCSLLESHIDYISRIVAEYRNLQSLISVPTIGKTAFEYSLFGDEFMSNTIELHFLRLLKVLKEKYPALFDKKKVSLLSIIHAERRYKTEKGFPLINENDPDNNRNIINRLGTLRKYMESHLFLNLKVKEDGAFVRQFYYSLAAGISMIFATVIAFSFQQKYGNFTMPLFFALVVGYMLKDRIKELSRFYFSHKLDSKYFDNKTDIKFNDFPIGWYKESQSFIKDHQTPSEVKQLRNRSAILEAGNQINDEKIILYRLRMLLDRKRINTSNIYPVTGVNNILRFNLMQFSRMMDDPHIPLYVPDDEDGCKIVNGEKIYYLNLILRYRYLDKLELKRYRILFNREGILSLDRF